VVVGCEFASGTESWLREEISNAEVFRDDYTPFRRDRDTTVMEGSPV
jgi:hypothetical protein